MRRWLSRSACDALDSRGLLASQEVWVAKTVLLETAWVLRHFYGLDRDAVLRVLRTLAGNERVRLEDALAVSEAIEWFSAGMDFADAIHLATRGTSGAFATFDRRLHARAAEAGVEQLVELLGED